MERRRFRSGRTSKRARSAGIQLLLLASLALACATDFAIRDLVDRSQGRLGPAAQSYADNLRWGRIEMAAALVEPELRAAFLDLFEGDDAVVRFTDIEVVQVEPGAQDAATVRVKARLYRPRLLTETQVSELQHWRYDRPSEKWFVAPDLGLYEKAGGV